MGQVLHGSTTMTKAVRPGRSAYTNKRRAIVTMIEENSPGQHDMLLAACDKTRFETLYALGIEIPFSPQP